MQAGRDRSLLIADDVTFQQQCPSKRSVFTEGRGEKSFSPLHTARSTNTPMGRSFAPCWPLTVQILLSTHAHSSTIVDTVKQAQHWESYCPKAICTLIIPGAFVSLLVVLFAFFWCFQIPHSRQESFGRIRKFNSLVLGSNLAKLFWALSAESGKRVRQ